MMKIFLGNAIAFLLAAAAITPATAVDNPCTICPDGFSEPEGFEADYCNMQKTSLAFFPADDEMFCTAEIVNNLESSCCPTPPDNLCRFCSDGIDVEGSPFASLMNETELAESVAVCEFSAELANALEADSEECRLYLQGAFQCCPTSPENPCQFCPGGIGIEGSPFASLMNETELAEMVTGCEFSAELANVLEADSEECRLYLQGDSSCCPTPPENPCQFCPGGIGVDGGPIASLMNETELAEMVTSCEYYVESANVLEADSEECSLYSMGESSCCPGKIENPCPVCGSTTVDISITFPELGGCNTLIEFASAMSADGIECPFMQLYETLCCPTPATFSCSICPEGYNINGDAYVMGESGPTCRDVAIYVEEDSLACTSPASKDELIGTCCVAIGEEVLMPSSGNATEDPAGNMTTLPPIADGPGNMTSSPVVTPVNKTNDPLDNATLSPVATPADMSSDPSPVPTQFPSPLPTLIPTIDSAASKLITSNLIMSPFLSVLVLFPIA